MYYVHSAVLLLLSRYLWNMLYRWQSNMLNFNYPLENGDDRRQTLTVSTCLCQHCDVIDVYIEQTSLKLSHCILIIIIINNNFTSPRFIIIIIIIPMFMVLSSWQSHCESLPGLYDGRRHKTKPDDLGCESARRTGATGCLLVSVKGLDTCYIAPLTWVRLVTSSALQSRKWQLIGMSQWCSSALCSHPLSALTDSWTHGAASRHTIAPISHTRLHPVAAVATTHFPPHWR